MFSYRKIAPECGFSSENNPIWFQGLRPRDFDGDVGNFLLSKIPENHFPSANFPRCFSSQNAKRPIAQQPIRLKCRDWLKINPLCSTFFNPPNCFTVDDDEVFHVFARFRLSQILEHFSSEVLRSCTFHSIVGTRRSLFNLLDT